MGLIRAEQTLLIALDEEKGSDSTHWGSDAGLAGALLLDPARLELVSTDSGGKIVALDGPQTGHALLRDAYTTIAGSAKHRGAKGRAEHLPHELKRLRQRLARVLVERGILAEEQSKLLGIPATTRFQTVDSAPAGDLRKRLRDVLLADREPTGEEALLVALLEPLGLTDAIVPKDRRKDARTRAKTVAEQGLTVTAVRDAIRAVQAAVIAAIGASTVLSAN